MRCSHLHPLLAGQQVLLLGGIGLEIVELRVAVSPHDQLVPRIADGSASAPLAEPRTELFTHQPVVDRAGLCVPQQGGQADPIQGGVGRQGRLPARCDQVQDRGEHVEHVDELRRVSPGLIDLWSGDHQGHVDPAFVQAALVVALLPGAFVQVLRRAVVCQPDHPGAAQRLGPDPIEQAAQLGVHGLDHGPMVGLGPLLDVSVAAVQVRVADQVRGRQGQVRRVEGHLDQPRTVCLVDEAQGVVHDLGRGVAPDVPGLAVDDCVIAEVVAQAALQGAGEAVEAPAVGIIGVVREVPLAEQRGGRPETPPRELGQGGQTLA